MKKYTLAEYSNLLGKAYLLKECRMTGAEAETVEYLTFDSKKVTEGTLFICKGAAFKTEYLEEAIHRGAIAYVSEKKYETETEIPYLLVEDIRSAMPALAEMFNNAPWKKLTIVGIGGTKGKSTSAYYMKAIVDDYMEATGGKESAILSSIDIYDGVIREESSLTTPEAIELQEHLRHAADSGITFAQMEVSSQALKYGRVKNMKLDVGIFLNISEDHISPIEHPDFEDYFASKLLMFKQTRYAVVNKDADFAERIIEAAKECERTITFSTQDSQADVYGYELEKDGHETVFRVKTEEFDEEFRLTMPGLFNVENALAVIGAAMLLHIPVPYMKSGLYRARSKGRMELYSSEDKQRIAIVDFAHNKLSYEKLFSSTKDEYPDYKIVAVFGSPGNKAITRRRDMGQIAGKNADMVYLTADDPAKEDVLDICKQIAVYVEEQNCPYKIVENRQEAIKMAMDEAEGKNVFLIMGKGDETWLKYGTKKVPCKSDAEQVKECLEAYNRLHV